MTSANEAFNILQTIAETPGKNDKQALLKDGFAKSPLLRRICIAAYDPFVTYGVARIPAFVALETPSTDMSDENVWAVLDCLANRKLSGNAAIDAVANVLSMMPTESQELFKRVLLRDLRAGFGENTINKVEKGAIKTFPYMRCSLPKDSNFDKWDWSQGVILQLKADGMFVNLTRGTDSEAWATTRAGTPVPDTSPQLQLLLQEAARILPENTQFHGEMTVYEGEQLLSRKVGNGILNSALAGEVIDPKYTVKVDLWDAVPLSAVQPKGKHEEPYLQRLRGLAEHLRVGSNIIQIIKTKVVRTKAEAMTIYRSYMLAGLEGAICKSPTAIWRDGTSKDQVKLKLDFDVELEVYGFEPGTPGTKTESTFGSLKCKSSDGLLLVDVSGFADALRQKIHENREDWTGAVITVKANDVIDRDGTDVKSLFLPRFVERRLDKGTANTLGEIIATKQATMEAA